MSRDSRRVGYLPINAVGAGAYHSIIGMVGKWPTLLRCPSLRPR